MHSIKYNLVFLIFCFLLVNCKSSGETPETNESTSTTSKKEVTLFTSFDQWLQNPQPMVSAHRGGPYPGFPENAIETFQNVVDQIPAVIECDVSMTKDSVLILLHDKTLDRTTTGSGNVTDWMYDKLRDLLLVDNQGDTTSYRIPTLDQALAWGNGKTLFTLDIKRGVPFEKVMNTINKLNATTYAAIITYRIQDAKLVHSLNSDIMISVSAGDEGALEQIAKSGIPAEKLLGFVGTREPEFAHYEKLQELDIKTILGTLGNLDKRALAKGDDSVYLTYISNGANIIATDRPLEVATILGTKF